MGKSWFTLLSPLLRYSYSCDAYILRGVGRRVGPVLRPERRSPRNRRGHPTDGIERRETRIA
jgi:hypothetical protein